MVVYIGDVLVTVSGSGLGWAGYMVCVCVCVGDTTHTCPVYSVTQCVFVCVCVLWGDCAGTGGGCYDYTTPSRPHTLRLINTRVIQHPGMHSAPAYLVCAMHYIIMCVHVCVYVCTYVCMYALLCYVCVYIHVGLPPSNVVLHTQMTYMAYMTFHAD